MSTETTNPTQATPVSEAVEQTQAAPETHSWTTFFKLRMAQLKVEKPTMTPSEKLRQIGEEWKTFPQTNKVKEVRAKRKAEEQTNGDGSADEDGADMSDGTHALTDSLFDEIKKKRCTGGWSHHAASAAFNGATTKLDIYSEVGGMMTKHGSANHRESIEIPLTKNNRKICFKALRLADQRIQKGELSDPYEALLYGITIPLKILSARDVHASRV